MAASNQAPAMLRDVAARIHDLREISGYSIGELARLTDVTEQDCARYEAGAVFKRIVNGVLACFNGKALVAHILKSYNLRLHFFLS